MRRVVLWPDTHVPYHDKKAFRLALKVTKKLNPTHLVILGDFADFYAVSAHDRNPLRRADLMWEVQSVNAALDDIQKLKIPRVIFCEGNHEWRLERYLMRKAPELFGMVRCKDLFHIQERGWKWVKYKSHYKIGKLYVTHDLDKAGKYAAAQTLDKFQGNIAFGHTHRASIHYSGNVRGESHVSATCGHLLDTSDIDYAHQRNLHEWQQGMGYATIEENGNVHFQFLPFLKGKCAVPTQIEMVR